MQYLLLSYANEDELDAIPPDQLGAVTDAIDRVVQDTMRGGQLRALGRLQPTAAATTVRERRGTLLTTDGPFAETREQLGGFYLIECADLDEALDVARRLAACRAGSLIEVRPLRPSFHD
ncbi:MAG: YciI family protein [Deltaproteobacteria bacterium]|nr:YciI family protein [Deltaproteobacteria bacterium]